MNFLRPARDRLELFLPGLDKQLADVPLLVLEEPGNPGLSLFRDAGGPALFVPVEFGGLGASIADGVQIQRAIGSRSPSLAVATTMHHFSVASLVELTAVGSGFEWAMLQAVAEQRWLVSSGFAEGRHGQHILRPTMRARPTAGGLIVNGVKKPCSLTWSMDVMSASVAVEDPEDGPSRMAIILISADSSGIERRKFWESWVLAGAESDEVAFCDVFVPDALVFYPEEGPGMDPVSARGFMWFELLIAAAYVGIASGLVERVIASGKGSAEDRALLAVELESATAALEHVATLSTRSEEPTSDLESNLALALLVRYGAERAVERAVMAAAATCGGMAFIGSSEIAYLLAASRALAFHPPSRASASEPLAQYLGGARLKL